MVRDSFHRDISELRLSVTDRCNDRCAYCVPPQGVEWLAPSEILSDDEILRVLGILGRHGVSKVRLTGGEPLVRSGFVELVRKIKALGVIEDISLTTNGSLLAQFAAELKQAGIDRVNISLDTVDPGNFREVTRGGEVSDVLDGIKTALSLGLAPVKINVVLTDAVSRSDLVFFQKLVHETPVAVRFIEYMPSERCRVHAGMTVHEVTEMLEKLAAGKLEAPRQAPHGCGPARYLQGNDDKGMYGFIAPISDGYCDRCNRIRLTADGRLRPCLLSDGEIDIKAALRRNDSDEAIMELFFQAIRNKPSSHSLKESASGAFQRRGMSQIGG